MLLLAARDTRSIKPNIIFGADQIDPTEATAAHSELGMRHCLWLSGKCCYWWFSTDCCTRGCCALAYIIIEILMALALVYTAKNTAPVVWPAVRCLLGGRHTTYRKVALMGWALLPTLILFVPQVFFPSHAQRALSLLVTLLCIGCLCACACHTETTRVWASDVQSAGVWTECQGSFLDM